MGRGNENEGNMPRIKNAFLALIGIHLPKTALQVGESSEELENSVRSETMGELGHAFILDAELRGFFFLPSMRREVAEEGGRETRLNLDVSVTDTD